MDGMQYPIGSGFGPRTSAIEALDGRDLAGKTAIVTGGYSGIGLETARVLSGAGATVVVPARNAEKARAALAGIGRVEREAVDLLDPGSIDAFAARFLATGRPLDLLVNSAGIMATPLTRDARGFETQFAANHLGHFQLTLRLWPALLASGGARVVAVSSRGHRYGGVDLDDPMFEHRSYDKWKAYGQSKTANILFARSLDRRGASRGVRAFSVHPGTIPETDLARHLVEGDLAATGIRITSDGKIDATEFEAKGGIAKTVEQGAATSLWASVSPLLDGLGGLYCEDCDVARAVAADEPDPNGVRPWALDDGVAEKLWTLSAALTGTAKDAPGLEPA